MEPEIVPTEPTYTPEALARMARNEALYHAVSLVKQITKPGDAPDTVTTATVFMARAFAVFLKGE